GKCNQSHPRRINGLPQILASSRTTYAHQASAPDASPLNQPKFPPKRTPRNSENQSPTDPLPTLEASQHPNCAPDFELYTNPASPIVRSLVI
ncbi:MAG: hypothetical protein ABI823_04570, partial [Bryobacteraceae bacterium]